jgi:hypothetical protein
VVGASRGHGRHAFPLCTHSRRRLDGCAHLDGLGVHLECEAVRTHALSLHRSVLPRDDHSGACDCFQWCLCEEIEIVFIEVKTGRSVLSAREKAVMKAVEKKKVSWRVFNPDLEVDRPRIPIISESSAVAV